MSDPEIRTAWTPASLVDRILAQKDAEIAELRAQLAQVKEELASANELLAQAEPWLSTLHGKAPYDAVGEFLAAWRAAHPDERRADTDLIIEEFISWRLHEA